MRILLLVTLTFLVGCQQATTTPAPDSGVPADPLPRPNLILLVTDDHPHDALGCAGHPILSTPHMDSLARDGVRFTHAFVTTPICAASRASFFTGMYERAHGSTFGQPPLSPEFVQNSYPVLLREAGYRVGFVGKFGVRVGPEARGQMFEEFAPGTAPYFSPGEASGTEEPEHLTERNTRRAIEFISNPDERPFCLSLSFQAPHAEDSNPDQYVWPAACDSLYVDASIPPAPTSEPEFFAALPEFLRTGFNRERWHWRFDTPEKYTQMVKAYYRMLTGVDQGIGRLLDSLDELGLRSNTVILLMGDNGYFLGERGYAGKWTMHDRSTRVPLIIHDPRQPAAQRGRLNEVFALNVDLAPTLLELAGVTAPATMQGTSLVPWIMGIGGQGRTHVFTEHLWKFEHIPRTEGLRTREWKYIRYFDHPEFEELYDLGNDPHEEHNLADIVEHADRLQRMRDDCTDSARLAEG